MKISEKTPIGEVVAQNYKTAAAFKKHQIDFCCNGNRSIEEACDTQKIDSHSLIDELTAILQRETDFSKDYKSMNMRDLADHIVENHHNYVEEKVPIINEFLDKLVKVHGRNHPELKEIKELFQVAGGELAQHMKKEELILFPYLRKLSDETPITPPPFGSVENPIAMMHQEHDTEGERFRKISELSNQYTPPADACNTYKATYAMLKEFEEDLHHHIHLENNILFPKGIEAEKAL